MENERNFYPTPEQKESKPKTYQVHFDDKHFGDVKKAIGTLELVGQLNEWWDKICLENGLNPKDKKIFRLGYYVIGLGKNALEYAEGGEIKVIFEPNKITVMVSDQGHGFEDRDHVEYSTSSQYGHGLAEIRKYANEFTVETGGIKYAKVAGKRKLAETVPSDIQNGSKITFIKNF